MSLDLGAMKNIIVEKANSKSAEEILTLQKTAYISEAEIIDDFTIPPLHQKYEEILKEFDKQHFLKVVINNEIVGSVRAYLENDTCYIGKLIVHPDFQNMGIGTKLLNTAEKEFTNAKRFELFTGEKSEKNLYLYKKNEYIHFRNLKVSEKLTLVFLEKSNHSYRSSSL